MRVSSIGGGLYNSTRDAIVGEDFILILLGEMLVFVNQIHQTPGAPPLLFLKQLDFLFHYNLKEFYTIKKTNKKKKATYA